MGLRVNNNIAALNAYRNLNATDAQQGKALEKLSSGLRINRAADDAAGLAISEGLRSQVGGLKVGVRNAQDGVSLAQTAEGALTEVHSMLQRMNDLAVQTANGNNSAESKDALQAEFAQLGTEIGRIQANTKFNGNKVFDGTAKDFQVGFDSADKISVTDTAAADFTGATGTGGVKMKVVLDAAGTDAANSGLNGTTAITSEKIQEAITEVSSQRAELGAIQNRFEHTINNVNTAVENLTASESRIRDTDMAAEMMNFTKTQILSQAGTAMLSQANQSSQGVLSLLR